MNDEKVRMYEYEPIAAFLIKRGCVSARQFNFYKFKIGQELMLIPIKERDAVRQDITHYEGNREDLDSRTRWMYSVQWLESVCEKIEFKNKEIKNEI